MKMVNGSLSFVRLDMLCACFCDFHVFQAQKSLFRAQSFLIQRYYAMVPLRAREV